MLAGMLTAFGVVAVILVLFLVVFSKQLRAMREKEGSVYKKLFKK